MTTIAATRHAARRPILPNGVLGMLVFIITELMFFSGLISAFVIAEGASKMPWPPAGQPRLPVEETAFNTGVLLASGLVLAYAGSVFRKNPRAAKWPLLFAMLLGAFFVVFQGLEWVALIGEGLTIRSSTHGSFFYLIVGTHAVHAVAAILGLLYVYGRLLRGQLQGASLATASVFWYFVVAIWPVLYFQVYL
jgi:heme/copper-type cytochrome/quinol oxidase subunit 3